MSCPPYLRVVVRRKGRVKPTEFRLRPGEAGLSLFRSVASPSAQDILEAVQLAGKQGELCMMQIDESLLHRFGLKLVATTGGTPDPEVNKIHVEARWSFWSRVSMRLRGIDFRDKFNSEVAPILAEQARELAGDEL